ncbi:ATP-binding protein [Streptomyces sp. NPDC056480]|uniref:ATP-binding protein n=1 Tax=Streptomyces sp. NPDC056480 TaxID=3345833 RepID=UPI0036CA6E36
MTVIRTDEMSSVQVLPRRIPLPGGPEDTLTDEACRDLRPGGFRGFVELATAVRREQAACKQFLPGLRQAELASRGVCRQQRPVRAARFPLPRREGFCYGRTSNVWPWAVAGLRQPSWVQLGRLLVLGDSGTGKLHLLTRAGSAVAEAGLSVRCTAPLLVNEVAEAEAGCRLSSVIACCSKDGRFCRSGSGCLTPDMKGARPLFQVFGGREEGNTAAVASDPPPFAERDKAFAEPRLCAAIAGRVTFRSTLIQTGTESRRFRITEAECRTR